MRARPMAATFAVVLGLSSASAGPLPIKVADDLEGLLFGERRADALAIPGVPDARGCIRMCDQDLNPCDPPLYKKADGRCTNDF